MIFIIAFSLLLLLEISCKSYLRFGTTSTTHHLRGKFSSNMGMHFASSLKSTVVLISFLISLLSSNTITDQKFSATASKDLINDICQKTKHPLCSKILKSDRRAHQASSPRVLGEITLDKAIACADSTAMLLYSLERTRNHQLREKYENCWAYYAFIYNYLEEAKDRFRNSDFGGVSKNIGAVVEELNTCQQQFQRPPVEHKKLKQENEKLRCLCSVSNHLSTNPRIHIKQMISHT